MGGLPMSVDPLEEMARDSKPVRRSSVPQPARIDVATLAQIDDLNYEIMILQQRMNELIVATNMHNRYMDDFRSRFNNMLKHRWYRFIMWVWPFGLPEYHKYELIPVFIYRDRKPRMR